MLDHLATVRKYALIVRGEHSTQKDAAAFARDVGYGFPSEAAELIQSLQDSAREYCLLTGLLPDDLDKMILGLRRGRIRARREIRREDRT